MNNLNKNEEVIFPEEVFNIGTPWKPKFVHKNEVTFVDFVSTWYAINNQVEYKFGFSGFESTPLGKPDKFYEMFHKPPIAVVELVDWDFKK